MNSSQRHAVLLHGSRLICLNGSLKVWTTKDNSWFKSMGMAQGLETMFLRFLWAQMITQTLLKNNCFKYIYRSFASQPSLNYPPKRDSFQSMLSSLTQKQSFCRAIGPSLVAVRRRMMSSTSFSKIQAPICQTGSPLINMRRPLR